jgi:hypothetical protein
MMSRATNKIRKLSLVKIGTREPILKALYRSLMTWALSLWLMKYIKRSQINLISLNSMSLGAVTILHTIASSTMVAATTWLTLIFIGPMMPSRQRQGNKWEKEVLVHLSRDLSLEIKTTSICHSSVMEVLPSCQIYLDQVTVLRRASDK